MGAVALDGPRPKAAGSGMKSSIHLFYGIIIGVLICACAGSNSDNESATPTNSVSNQENVASSTNTATPTSSIADQKQFKELRKVRYFSDSPQIAQAGFFTINTNGKFRKQILVTAEKAYRDSPDHLREAGWTVLDMEIHRATAAYNWMSSDQENVAFYLIGR